MSAFPARSARELLDPFDRREQLHRPGWFPSAPRLRAAVPLAEADAEAGAGEPAAAEGAWARLAAAGREAETARLRAALDRCLAGAGSVVALHGSVGSGRSELLYGFAELAAGSGAQVLLGTGSPLERGFPLGLVRQLLQSAELDGAAAAEAAELLADGVRQGAPARPADEPAAEGAPSGLDQRTLEGLTRIVLELAGRAPVLIAVDDRQDADVPSLEFLLYLVRRTRNAPVLTLLSSRETMTPENPFFEVELASQPHHERVRLNLLPPGQVEQQLADRLGVAAAAVHTVQAHALTGGNPLLLRALIDDQGSWPQPADGGLAVGEGYRRALMNCLHRIDPLALRCARGVAALGGSVEVPLLAELLQLGADSLERAFYLLRAAGLFGEDGFRHPSGGGDLLAAVRPAELAALQQRAAELLAGERGSAPAVAESPPVAAVPSAAAAPLITAVPSAEAAPPITALPPVAAVPQRAEQVAIQCVPWLPGSEQTDPPLRRELKTVRHHFWHGRVDQGLAGLARLDAEPGGPEETGELRSWLAYWYPGLLPEAASRPTPSRGPVHDGLRVLETLLRGAPAERVVPQAERILRESRLGRIPMASLTSALTVLLYTDRADRAARWCGPIAERTGTRCADTWHALFSALLAEAQLRQGDLKAAEESARAAFSRVPPQGWGVAVGFPLATMVAVRTALGRHQDAARFLELAVPEEMDRTPAALHYRHALGGHLLATGEPERALAEFRSCGEAMARWGLDHLPALAPWRIGAARAQLALGRPVAAAELADQQLARLTPAGQPRVRGMALRVRAAAGVPAERSALLESAVAVLEESGDEAELGAALAELSEAQDVLGDPVQARHTSARLRGAPVAVAPAVAPSAVPAAELSEAEQRVAELAARGLSNREVARRLYITVSTVEQHLTRVYRKLGVRRRVELRNLLASGGGSAAPAEMELMMADQVG
ncbi:AAA family ATPase [Kitasatospora sp. NPDC006697]|uniref:AAA family ATPase n=1 Tax=Kitasatospora sp. NPDC006697 TaxID=3364020 RepID=UPI0036ADB9AD